LAQRIYETEDTMAKTQKWTASTFVSLVHENLTDKGHKVKKADLSWAVKDAFEAAVAAGARGMRVRFPEIGALASRDVKARNAGKRARVGRGPGAARVGRGPVLTGF